VPSFDSDLCELLGMPAQRGSLKKMDAMMPQTEFILLVIFLLLALVLLSWEARKNLPEGDEPADDNAAVTTTLGNQD
jgi:hypothetical protein